MYRLAVNLFFLINGFVYANWAARIPALQDSLDLSNKQIGLILLAHAIGAFIAMPVTGFLISKYSSKKVTTISGLLFPFFFLCIPWMDSFTTLLIPFFAMGMATGMMDVAMNAQAVEVEKAYQKPIMTFFHAMFSIGMVLGGIAGGLAISGGFPTSQHFPAVFIVAMIFLFFCSKHLYPDAPAEQSDEPWFVLPKGALIGLGIIGFCCMMGEGAISDWSTIYMKKIVQSDEYLYAYGLTGFAAMMTVGRLLGDKGRLRFGDYKMLIGGSILSLLGIGLVLSLVNPFIVILGFAIVGLGVSNIVPIVYSIAGSMPDIKPGVGIAMVTTIGYTGFMIGPPVIGFVADVSSLHIALFLLAGLFLIMTVLIQYMKS
jgi:MFS family permease